ncbi:hypothetical protein [Streptomyces sp. NRRL S-1824]|uniref:hypothetical protein n=1 Tax=Streptomyces sp. NRRL S-1824 TaxID=1463889 RepID=UPI0007C59FBE|nr:hypothetical protein [Streptomyces sp. NRRL S-1824]
MLTGKTKHSVRNAKLAYAQDPEVCPVRAWTAYRTRLVTEHGEQWADPSTPAFVGIDRHGHITGGLVSDSVTRAVTRISKRAGVPIHWTGHSLRIGLASTGRKKGKDGIAIADQGVRGFVPKLSGFGLPHQAHELGALPPALASDMAQASPRMERSRPRVASHHPDEKDADTESNALRPAQLGFMQ